MEHHFIFSTRPQQCVDFYTRLLGLEWRDETVNPVAAPQCASPDGVKIAQAETDVSGAAPASQPPDQLSGHLSDQFPDQWPAEAVFRIDSGQIARVLPEDAPSILGQPMARIPGSEGQDMYFLTRYSLDFIHARLRAENWPGLGEPVRHKGAVHTLRVLHLIDPDGNRLRLVELSI